MIKLEVVSGGLEKPKEPSLKLLLRWNLWNIVKIKHFLYEFWRTYRFLTKLEMVSWPEETLGSFTKIHKNLTGLMLNGNFSKKWPMGAVFRL